MVGIHRYDEHHTTLAYPFGFGVGDTTVGSGHLTVGQRDLTATLGQHGADCRTAR
jgi:hypothetical protein